MPQKLKDFLAGRGIQINEDSNSSVLLIKNSIRSDSGEYSLSAKNEAGAKSIVVHCQVLDAPSKPIGPIEFEELTPEYAVITWIAPKDNGGDPINNYIVEKSIKNQSVENEEDKQQWKMVSSKGNKNKMRIPRLLSGKTYLFRVRAENKYGVSESLISEPTIAKHSFSVPSIQSPPVVVEIIESACTVTWKMPESDGGSAITGFIVERMDVESGKWSKCNHEAVLGNSMRVKGLFEGRQ